MSNNSISSNTGRQLFVNTDLSKIFIYENRSVKAPYNNSAYGSVTLRAGTVMGRVASTGYVKPLESTFSDGAQIPVGVLMEDLVADGGVIMDVTLCNYGDVAQEQLIFVNGTDNLNTTVSSQRLRDRLHSDAGVRLVQSTDLSDYDN